MTYNDTATDEFDDCVSSFQFYANSPNIKVYASNLKANIQNLILPFSNMFSNPKSGAHSIVPNIRRSQMKYVKKREREPENEILFSLDWLLIGWKT